MYKLVIASVLLVGVYGQLKNPRDYLILKQNQDISPEGNYFWEYETENGIAAQEQGVQKQTPEGLGTAAQGSFQYVSPEGIPIAVAYTADENGFQPQGAHLPTPPPIPPQILRALEWIKTHPQQPTRFA